MNSLTVGSVVFDLQKEREKKREGEAPPPPITGGEPREG